MGGEQRAKDALVVVEHLPDAIPALKSDFELRQRLLQWNLSDRLKLLRFRIHRRVASEEDERAVIHDFFRDDAVRRLLDVRRVGYYARLTRPDAHFDGWYV
jgi:hypothetical protein